MSRRDASTDHRAVLRDVSAALTRSHHVLLEEPSQLRGQLFGRLRGDWPVAVSAPATGIRLVPERGSLSAAGMTLIGHNGAVLAVVALPDARRLASAGADGTIRLWDLRTGAQTGWTVLPEGRPRCIAASVDGVRIAIGAGTRVDVWHTDTHAFGPGRDLGSEVLDIAWSPRGACVAGTEDGLVRVWNPDHTGPVAVLQGHEDAVTAVAVMPGGRRVVSASLDATVRVWDVDLRTTQAVLPGTWALHAVDVSADGRYVVAGADQVPVLWDLDDARGRAILTSYWGPVHDSHVDVVAFTGDGDRIVSSDSSVLKVWSTSASYPLPGDGRQLPTWEGHLGSVTDVTMTPDGRSVVSSSVDGSIRLWDPLSGGVAEDPVEWLGFGPDGQPLSATVRYEDTDDGAEWESALRIPGRMLSWYYRIYAISQSADRSRVLVHVGNDTEVVDVSTGEKRRVRVPGGAIISPDGTRALSGAGEALEVWHLEVEQGPTRLQTGPAPLVRHAWSSDARGVFAADEQGNILSWGLGSPGEPTIVPVGPGPIQQMAVGRDDEVVAIDGAGTIHLVQARAGSSTVLGEVEDVIALRISPDRALAVVVVGGPPGVANPTVDGLLAWDLRSRRPLRGASEAQLRTSGVHQSGIRGNPLPTLDVVAGRPWVVTCFRNDVRVWDLTSGRALASFTADSALEACRCAPDGDTLLVGTVAGGVHSLHVLHDAHGGGGRQPGG